LRSDRCGFLSCPTALWFHMPLSRAHETTTRVVNVRKFVRVQRRAAKAQSGRGISAGGRCRIGVARSPARSKSGAPIRPGISGCATMGTKYSPDRGHAGAHLFGTRACPRIRVRGHLLRQDVPVMQSPLKPLTDLKGWTRTGTIGTEKSRMSPVQISKAISRDSTIAGHSLRQDLENWDMLPQPPKGWGAVIVTLSSGWSS
jgi:hypothetical protein